MTPGYARSGDPETSHAAARLDATWLERAVLTVICAFADGCIGDDVEDALPAHRLVSISPRFRPLLKKGFIADTGERRLARSGRTQRVMRVTDKGRLALLSRGDGPMTVREVDPRQLDLFKGAAHG